MYYSICSRPFSLICFCLSVLLTTTLLSDAATADHLTEAPVSLQRLRPLPVSFVQGPRNGSSGTSLHMTGCFAPAPGIRVISPQDALIVLGSVANVVAFFNIRRWDHSVVLATSDTAVIAVIKIGYGPDEFSLFDIASQAITIVHYCIVQQLPTNRLGGALEVGSRNRFRVVVQGRAHFEKDLPEAR